MIGQNKFTQLIQSTGIPMDAASHLLFSDPSLSPALTISTTHTQTIVRSTMAVGILSLRLIFVVFVVVTGVIVSCRGLCWWHFC